MRCPFCNHDDSKVTDSRISIDTNAIRRRRECLKCSNRFTTFEMLDLTLQVKKRNGTYEDYNQDKLLKGLQAASFHSKISHDQVRTIVNQITAELLAKQIREISSQELGELVMQHLKRIDVVAYIRFACVYKRFKHIDDLVEALKTIIPKDEINKLKNEENEYGVEKNRN